MNRNRAAFVAMLVVCLLTAIPNVATATDGYFMLGYGTVSKGMGGTGVAFPTNTLAAATNPAAMVFVGQGYDLGLAAFSPDREFTVTGNPSGYPGTFGLTPGTVRSDTRIFLVPNLGANWMVSKNDSIGVSIYGNGGMNTTYNASVFYGSTPTGIDMGKFYVVPTWAHKFGENHSVGISPMISWQRFKAYGLEAFGNFSSDPSKLTGNGYATSFGYGGRIGYMGNWTPWLSVGASYQTEVKYGRLKEYAGLFAGQGYFDDPANWTVGLALKPTSSITFAFDVQQIYFSKEESVGNPMLPNLMQARLGDDGGAGFGWKDMTVYKLGLEWKATDALTLRAGYATGKQPIPESEVLFNILAPGVIEQHATVGASYQMSKGNKLNLSVIRAFSKTVTGPNPLEVPGKQTISLTMDQWDFELGFSFGF
ncbi:MAG TPA: outer membrane protein transport protein [Thermoanaerobaculia bacterium]